LCSGPLMTDILSGGGGTVTMGEVYGVECERGSGFGVLEGWTRRHAQVMRRVG